MPVNFFDNPHMMTTSSHRFGLCDDVAPINCPRNPAYIDETDEDKWTAVVCNSEHRFTSFYPIDNCIEIRREDGQLDRRCDGLLKYDNDLIFVELKDRASGSWVAAGFEQLKTTIENFNQNHDSKAFRIRAQLCNKQKPFTVYSCHTAIERFKEETGYTVTVNRTITL